MRHNISMVVARKRGTRGTHRRGTHRLAPSGHAQSRMAERAVSAAEVRQCKQRGRWMRHPVSGRKVLCFGKLILGARPFAKGIATVMCGTVPEYVPCRPRMKLKQKYKDAKHICRWGFR